MTISKPLSTRTKPGKKQQGFTLLEVLVAIICLTVALVGLLSVFAFAAISGQTSQQDMIAKQLASQAMESIFTARDTDQIVWSQIQNVGAGTTPDGIFVTGFQPINNPGADGLEGTADDSAAGAMVWTSPGPDGILGTADDVTVPLTEFTRQIQITGTSNPSLRNIVITISYDAPKGNLKTYTLTGYISQYR